MREIALSMLDAAENSIAAGAKTVEISIYVTEKEIKLSIKDDGRGMNRETLKNATDPFFTTRKTRNVGLGLSLLKMDAELSGGKFFIDSVFGKGTVVEATYERCSVNTPPIGKPAEAIIVLLSSMGDGRLTFAFGYNDKEFVFDSQEEKVKGDWEEDSPLSLKKTKATIQENIQSLVGGVIL